MQKIIQEYNNLIDHYSREEDFIEIDLGLNNGIATVERYSPNEYNIWLGSLELTAESQEEALEIINRWFWKITQ